MAGRIRNGGSSLLAALRELMRLYRKYGAAPLVARTDQPDLATLLAAMLTKYELFLAADDYPGEIEPGLPAGPEDP
jgi:hypothetical protein